MADLANLRIPRSWRAADFRPSSNCRFCAGVAVAINLQLADTRSGGRRIYRVEMLSPALEVPKISSQKANKSVMDKIFKVTAKLMIVLSLNMWLNYSAEARVYLKGPHTENAQRISHNQQSSEVRIFPQSAERVSFEYLSDEIYDRCQVFDPSQTPTSLETIGALNYIEGARPSIRGRRYYDTMYHPVPSKAKQLTVRNNIAVDTTAVGANLYAVMRNNECDFFSYCYVIFGGYLAKGVVYAPNLILHNYPFRFENTCHFVATSFRFVGRQDLTLNVLQEFIAGYVRGYRFGRTGR